MNECEWKENYEKSSRAYKSVRDKLEEEMAEILDELSTERVKEFIELSISYGYMKGMYEARLVFNNLTPEKK